MVELLKQPQGVPMPVADQVLMIKGAAEGMLDTVEIAKVADFQEGFLKMVHEEFAELVTEINEKKILGSDGEAKFKEAIERFTQRFEG